MSTSSTCRVAFLSHGAIWITEADGSEAQRVGKVQSLPSTVGFRWSPDGQWAAFWTRRELPSDVQEEALGPGAARSVWGVFVVNLCTGHSRDLTGPSAISGIHPCWHPGSRRVAFVQGHAVWSVDVDGSGLQHLLATNLALREPTWRPDGSHIFFLAQHPEAGKGLTMHRPEESRPKVDRNTYGHIVRADGSGHRRVALVRNSFGSRAASWSPDGRQITYGGEGGLWIAGTDGSEPTPLTSAGGSVLRPWDEGGGYQMSISIHDTAPAWSPDGSRIAFVSTRTGCSQIYTVAPDGTRLTQLTHEIGGDHGPVWSRDGRKIAFVSMREFVGRPSYNSDNTVWIMDADGSNQRCVSREQRPCDAPDIF